jgi:hypothetical protein
LTLADVNDDGQLDLVTGEWGGDLNVLPTRIVSYLGNDDGTFQPGVASDLRGAFAPVALSFASGDLDGDNLVDLVVPSSHDYAVGVLLGAGDGTFSLAESLTLSGAPTAAVVGDFDGDGKLDVAATEWDAFGSFAGI